MKLTNLYEAKNKSVKGLKKYPFPDRCKVLINLTGLELTSLEGSPSNVQNNFLCGDNLLTSLKGAPKEVTGAFACDYNKLTSLEYSPSIVGECFCNSNNITSLVGVDDHFKRINSLFRCYRNPIKAGGLGLLLIDSLSNIETDIIALEIVRTYLGHPDEIYECQAELIEQGFEEFAQI